MRDKIIRFISMCGTCNINSINREDSSTHAEDAPDPECLLPKLVKHPKRKRSPVPVTPNIFHSNGDMDSNQYDQVQSLDHVVGMRRVILPLGIDRGVAPSQVEDYERQRQEIKFREAALSWDYQCMTHAEDYEVRADDIIRAIRKWDEEVIYAKAKEQVGYHGQKHRRFMGDHYLTNVELIAKTQLFAVAQKMPKGAHLHIHFNANLLPEVLVGIAARQKRMFIMSDRPLRIVTDVHHPDYYLNFDQARIQFSILSEDRVRGREADLFDLQYPTVSKAEMNGVMKFSDFLNCFGDYYRRVKNDKGETYSAKDWLCGKIVFDEQEAHGLLQTAEGTWDRFNGRTQMMKGLFNYVTAYREYTRACLQAFVDDNIQYAEIRPNFMDTNQLWTDDGVSQIDNVGIMNIIVEECKNFAAELNQLKEGKKYFAGIKVIYCTPRSSTPDKVEKALQQCLWFKKHKVYGKYIAGQFSFHLCY
jgi:adenosine deaminase CECR1